jgi:hypothetical protein
MAKDKNPKSKNKAEGGLDDIFVELTSTAGPPPKSIPNI